MGYFGSYARGDYVPGSDFDVLIEIAQGDGPRRDRADRYLPDRFPVGVELFDYTADELEPLRAEGSSLVAAMDEVYQALIGQQSI